MKPQEIEDLSFKIIEEEAGNHTFSKNEWPVVRRMIHTSADFEYINTVRFHPKAIQAGIDAIRKGCRIFTDTHMARVGIRKKEIQAFGGEVHCLIADEAVAKKALAAGTTRALAAVDMACDKITGGIYVIGNAPTALLRLMELVREKKASPALIIGLPVGFVNAAESKEELMTLDFPHITNKGRKGGSNIAASVVNALAIMANEQP
ncbi:MAG: precorrin-8X methylmutase [Desulfobacula sp.]|jgi:precorrin-8X/cobalt-precorrin-8 methylmutase